MGNESNTTLETQFVLRRLEEALRVFGKQVEARWFWAFVLGVILLVATPVSRVAFSIYAFARQKDAMYVVITMIVLGLLVFSLVWGGL